MIDGWLLYSKAKEDTIIGYYDKFWREVDWNDSHYFRPYSDYRKYLDFLGVGGNGSLLDVGCGRGMMLRAGLSRGLSVTGVDISEVVIGKLLKRGWSVRCCKAEEMPFTNKDFGYITCLGSLEHFLDMGKALKEMVRVAKDDAKFCISVPNRKFMWWWFKRKKGTFQRDIVEHLLSLKEWKDLFDYAGLKVKKVHPDMYHASKSWFHWLAFRLVPLRWTYQFIFIMEKK